MNHCLSNWKWSPCFFTRHGRPGFSFSVFSVGWFSCRTFYIFRRPFAQGAPIKTLVHSSYLCVYVVESVGCRSVSILIHRKPWRNCHAITKSSFLTPWFCNIMVSHGLLGGSSYKQVSYKNWTRAWVVTSRRICHALNAPRPINAMPYMCHVLCV